MFCDEKAIRTLYLKPKVNPQASLSQVRILIQKTDILFFHLCILVVFLRLSNCSPLPRVLFAVVWWVFLLLSVASDFVLVTVLAFFEGILLRLMLATCLALSHFHTHTDYTEIKDESRLQFQHEVDWKIHIMTSISFYNWVGDIFILICVIKC